MIGGGELGINRIISEDKIKKCLDGNSWDFGNKILYEMCENYPLHQSADEVIGKIWLIGRTYSAAIERRKNAGENNFGDDFYFNVVAPKMLSIGKDLDLRIQGIKKYSGITEDNLEEIIETHSFVTKIFSDISGLSKRSLASKYLHFHAPLMFYIYDSRSMIGARKFVGPNEQLKMKLKSCGDRMYIELVSRLFELEKHINRQFNLKVTPRVIDSFLLEY